MKSRAGCWLGGALVAAGVPAPSFWFVVSLLDLGDKVDAFQRVPVPGEETVRLEAQKYVIYYESSTADEFVPAFAIDIVDAATGAPAPVAGYGGTLTYSYSGHEGSAVATVTPPTAGDYLVRTDGDPGVGTANVALGESLAGPLLRTILGAFGIGAVLGLSGVALIGVTAVRRSRLHPAPLGESGQAAKGPLGRPRGVGFGILMFVVRHLQPLLGFKTQEETKHTGEGLGGVLGSSSGSHQPGQRIRDPVGDRGDVQARRPRAADDRLDGPVALSGLAPDRAGDRLVRAGAGRPEPLLGS
jgi:hypothetical protein